MQKIVETSADSFKCFDLPSLQAFLSTRAMATPIPHGIKYEFADGLVVNCYATGSVTIQGQETKGTLANDVRIFVELVNKSKTG